MLESLAFDAGGLVIVEIVSHAVLVEPGARLLHRVAVLDAVDGDGHEQSLCFHESAMVTAQGPTSKRYIPTLANQAMDQHELTHGPRNGFNGSFFDAALVVE